MALKELFEMLKSNKKYPANSKLFPELNTFANLRSVFDTAIKKQS